MASGQPTLSQALLYPCFEEALHENKQDNKSSLLQQEFSLLDNAVRFISTHSAGYSAAADALESTDWIGLVGKDAIDCRDAL